MAKLSSSNGLEKRPKLRFPEFKEPWNLVKLEDVCSYRKGRDKVKKAQYISTENILQNYAGIEPYDDLSEAEGISIQCGDTLMANIRPYLKKVWQSNFNGACSTDVLAFSPDNIDGKFLYFLIAQDRFVNYVMCGAKGSKMPRGDKNHILEYETGVPTESEQRKIAHFIDLLNARISSQNSLINLIKKYKRGSLSALFPKEREITPQYRFAGFTNHWEQRKLDNITDVRDGTHDSPQYVENGHPFITSKNVKDGYINYEDVSCISDKDYEEINKRSKVDKNDILMGMIGTIGNIALVREIPDFAIKNVALIKDTSNVFYRYLYHCLQSNSIAQQLGENLDGGTQKFIALNKIRELNIPVPTEDEQHKIGDYMEQLDSLITLHQHKYDILLSLKNALLQQMFI